jgi:hypothetical protein
MFISELVFPGQTLAMGWHLLREMVLLTSKFLIRGDAQAYRLRN